MMFHNGRRWFINGGWPNFARGNGLRVGDICLFELKKKEKKLTMAVYIIRKEQFQFAVDENVAPVLSAGALGLIFPVLYYVANPWLWLDDLRKQLETNL